MSQKLNERVSARNRRQREKARELRRHADLHRYMQQFSAKQKIKGSRRRIALQVFRSRKMARLARQKAIRARDRAQRR